jgi:cysteine desulfurase
MRLSAGHSEWVRAYLDHAATTPMLPEAVEAMSRELTRVGNASSLHGSGRSARRVVEEFREAIAARLGARPAEVVFTSGGTEADNLAIKGAFWSRRDRRGIVTSAVEHHAVLEPAGWLAQAAGAALTVVPVDGTGTIERAALQEAVTGETGLVSVVWGNNEVGTLQLVAEVAALAAEHGALSHSDAVQAVGHVPVDFAASGLDLLSCSAHKLGGPYGIGALLVRREVALTAVLHGGGQERDVRSGTVNVAAVAGFAAAAEVAVGRLTAETHRIRELRAALIEAVRTAVPDAVLHGPAHTEGALPGIVNLGFPGCAAEDLLLLLDAAGIDCATGAACSAGVAAPSHVLLAMGLGEAEARSSLRFSLGHSSTAADIETLAAALPEAVRRARLSSARPLAAAGTREGAR